MNQVKVHGLPASQNCCSPIILAMELKAGGMEFCNIMEGQHKQPAFLGINPAGTVPALEDGSVVGGESNAILRYIALKYGNKYYPPSSPAACFKIDFALDDFSGNVYPEHTEVVYVALGFKKGPDQGTQSEANRKYGEAVNGWMARHLAGKFGLGEQLSLIEFKVLPFLYAAMQPVVRQKTGFCLSSKARTYVEEMIKAIPLGSKFLTDGDFSIQKFSAKNEGGHPAPISAEEPFKAGTPLKIGTPGPRGSVKVYAMPPSQNSCGPVIMAMEARAGNMAMCDLMSGAHKKPDFLAVNPCGKIPALEDGSVKGGESSAIMRYLAAVYAPPYYPKSDPGDCFRIDFAMDDFVNNVYKAHVEVVYPVFGFKGPAPDKYAANREYREKIEKWMKDHIRGQYVLGSNISIADIKVVPFFYSALQPAVKKTGFMPPPRLERYVQDIMAQVSATSFLESAGGYSIKEYLAGK